ncbi:hypothetical protein BDZ94DRAFT_990885 [Collybia nuda]|uniref:Uncharacterized protein n=1 Tax=Collybia nuda TaxID=64659 RepID=A0A9P6CG70_9AGAR|nr:hypothetical protein BDZ94DRAFT_990885 [Collybia nuda]
MPSASQILATALEIEGEGSEEEVSVAIGALLISAIKDGKPRVPLSRILQEVTQAGCASLLDPLDAVPVLLSSRDQAAKDLISLMGECSSAKEVIIAVQESMEHIRASVQLEDEEDEGPNMKELSFPSQLNILIGLYTSAVPRLKLRHKTAFETINPLLAELQEIIPSMVSRATCEEGRALITSVSQVLNNILKWITTSISIKDDESLLFKGLLKSLLDCTIDSFANMIHSSLAQRTFEHLFPRFTIRPALEAGWEGGREAVQDAIHAYQALGFFINFSFIVPSTSSMVIMAHSDINAHERSQLLSNMIPIVLASIQANSALDEALTILLKSLEPQQQAGLPDLAPEIIIPLCMVIPTLSSSHPDPLVRHQAFRILSLLLAASPGPLRFQILSDLTIDQDLPQMRIAAVGLVKEALLDALTSSSNIFASSAFLRVFGPILFRPSPPELFGSELTLGDFKDTPEPQRLTECLALYYILLNRDTSNLTGIRDSSTMLSIENALLKPLRTHLRNWLDDPTVSGEWTWPVMPL